MAHAEDAAQPACRFVLGFAELANMLGPTIAGSCVEDQRTVMADYQDEEIPGAGKVYKATRGEAVQRTTRGLMVWSKDFGRTQFLDSVGIFDLGSGTDRQQTWMTVGEAGTPSRPPRTDRDRAEDLCFQAWSSALTASLDFTGTPDGRRESERRKAQAQVMYDLCKEASEADGTRGAACSGEAGNSALASEQVFAGTGRQTYNRQYRACIARR